MARPKDLLWSLGLGMGVMYFFDPNLGKRRRKAFLDKAFRLQKDAEEFLESAQKDLQNRIKGTIAEISSSIREKQDLREVFSEWTESGRGKDQARSGILEWEQKVWAPAMRLTAMALGGGLGVLGLAKPTPKMKFLQLLGAGLVARGLANKELRVLLGLTETPQAIVVQKDIHIQAPAEELYSFWSNFENLPKFMEHLNEVKDLGGGRSRWKVVGPAQIPVFWEAIVTRRIPNEEIAWESLQGFPVKTSGVVKFLPTPEGGTRVTVRLGYTPPAGALGHIVASILGHDPKKALDDDLGRLKTLFESGKTRIKGKKVTQEELRKAQKEIRP